MDLRTASVFRWFTINSTGSQHMILNMSAVYIHTYCPYLYRTSHLQLNTYSLYLYKASHLQLYICILCMTSHLTSRLLREDWKSWMPVDII